MKIHLVNFLCYSDSVFEFDKEGLVLISGPSGCGKTSIVRGIFFALFGEGNKVQTYGKTSSSVTFEFEDIKIVRKKRPNHLVLNDIYEDEAAQEIINKKFGATFKVNGYLQQNYNSSFILMNPLDKLSFLEKFAFQDVNLGEIKSRCKGQITTLHDNLTGVAAQLEMTKKVLENTPIPTKVKFPLTCTKSSRLIAIKNVHTKIKNVEVRINKTDRIKVNTEKEMNDLKVLNAIETVNKDNIFSITTKLTKLDADEGSIKFIGTSELLKLEKELENVINLRELSQMEKYQAQNIKKLQKMTESEQQCLIDEIELVDKNMWQEYTPTELTSTVSDLKTCLIDMEHKERLRLELCECKIDIETITKNKDKLSSIDTQLVISQEKLLKLIAQKQSYFCPKCETALNLMNEMLVIINVDECVESEDDVDDIKKEIQKLRVFHHKLQKLISEQENTYEIKIRVKDQIKVYTDKYDECPTCKDLKEDINFLQKYEISQNQLYKHKENLTLRIENQIFSASYTAFKQDITRSQQNIAKLKEKIDGNDTPKNEEELRKNILTQKSIYDKLQFIKHSRQELTDEKISYEDIISVHKKEYNDCYGDIKNLEVLEESLVQIVNELKELQKQKIHYTDLLVDIKIWEEYQEQLKTYTDWKNKVTLLEKSEREERNKYAAMMTLKEKIMEAESLAMVNIIDSINTHARWYLDCFFVDNPISVQLQTFKETKKSTKPSINVEIEYKGMECDLHMLSGGELSRIVLAYTLALSEMFNTPLLLLDECTANLDQDLTNIVCDGIRENFKGKLVIIIAHQVVSGTFDQVITLK